MALRKDDESDTGIELDLGYVRAWHGTSRGCQDCIDAHFGICIPARQRDGADADIGIGLSARLCDTASFSGRPASPCFNDRSEK